MAVPNKNDILAITQEVDTPALVVDLDIFDTNVREMVAMCRANGVAFLPHSKTHRIVELANRQLELGADGLTVATIREAEAFVAGGATRIVSAYPLVGDGKIRRYFDLTKRAHVMLSTDSVEGANAIGTFFASRNSSADLILLVDSGMGRVGVRPEDAVSVAERIAQIDGLTLRGILTHEGTAYRAETPPELVEQSTCLAQLMIDTAERIRRAGIPIDVVSVGASASAKIAPTVPGITDVRPGAVAFNDLSQIALDTATVDQCAARVIATVISNPVPGQGCIDAGSKSLSNDRPPGCSADVFPGHGMILELPGWEITRLSEEHGWLRWKGQGPPPSLSIGQRVQVIPNHICTVFSSSGGAIGVADNHIVGAWPTISRGLPALNV